MNPHYLISLGLLYKGCGCLLAAVAWRSARQVAHPRRWGSTVFWAVLAVLFLAGESIPVLVVGYAVLVLVGLAATGQVAVSAGAAGPESPQQTTTATRVSPELEFRRSEAARLGNRVFTPALIVPLVALVGSRLMPFAHAGNFWLGDPKQATVAALGLGAMVGLAVAIPRVGARPTTPLREGARLVELLGWSLALPQLLAALGGVFQQCGVGSVVADLTSKILPADSALIAVVAYCVGMAAFTVCVGNAFAAFAVITGGIGLPLIVHAHHGNPAIMAALGMLSGYCGTLVTPMAANFNLVPVLLLELPDRNAVIKAQAPIAAALLVANIVIMDFCVYRF